MGTEKYIELLKTSLLRQSTITEKEELMTFLKEDEDCAAVYKEVFSVLKEDTNSQEIKDAYTKHLNRMKKLKLL